ncbi:hypothetical protein [Vibrio alginolyticus]
MNGNEKEKQIDQLNMLATGKESSAKPHSWERVDEIRKELLTDTDNYPWRAAAEDLWKETSYAQQDDLTNIPRENKRAATPLEALLADLDMPRYQPIEVLVAVKEAFSIYMNARGKLTLEDVFFGPLTKGVGNYAARSWKYESYKDFDFYVNSGCISMTKDEFTEHKSTSLENKAIEFLAYGMNPEIAKTYNIAPDYHNIADPESYLRGYRRWKQEADK